MHHSTLEKNRKGYYDMDYTVRMKALREDNDLAQREVAAYLQIDQRTYSRYETGSNALPSKMFELLCDYYNVSADYMLGRSENKYFDGNKGTGREPGSIKRKKK